MKIDILRKQAPLLALIAFICAVFVGQILFGPEWYRGWMVVPAKITSSWKNLITGDLSLVSVLPFLTLLTSALLHGGIEHLLLNMIFLWIFAALIVELLGARWMFILFLTSAIGGSIFHTIVNANEIIPMLGASGAVMGFEGAYLGLAIRWKLPDPHIWPMARPIPPANLATLAVVGIIIDVSGLMSSQSSNVAFGAHIGGFLVGMFITSFIAPRPDAAA
ncbi:MAG TPA: rhomboid family intramembrane serine protease [Opitutales bacterium]|nr:rhomboid family intramembrane serine protease [Opitutales bacterium]